MSGMCDVTRYQGDTKGLLFSSICVNIVLFSTHKGVMMSEIEIKICLIKKLYRGLIQKLVNRYSQLQSTRNNFFQVVAE